MNDLDLFGEPLPPAPTYDRQGPKAIPPAVVAAKVAAKVAADMGDPHDVKRPYEIIRESKTSVWLIHKQ